MSDWDLTDACDPPPPRVDRSSTGAWTDERVTAVVGRLTAEVTDLVTGVRATGRSVPADALHHVTLALDVLLAQLTDEPPRRP